MAETPALSPENQGMIDQVKAMNAEMNAFQIAMMKEQKKSAIESSSTNTQMGIIRDHKVNG